MEEYNKSGDKQVLHDAVEKQVSELHTEIEMLRTLKYPVMEMVNDTDVENIKHLRQMRFNPDLLDYALNEGANRWATFGCSTCNFHPKGGSYTLGSD